MKSIVRRVRVVQSSHDNRLSLSFVRSDEAGERDVGLYRRKAVMMMFITTSAGDDDVYYILHIC